MTLTPDRTPENPEERNSRPGSRDAGAGPADDSSVPGPASLFDQLKDANLDLTGHPLAKKFEALAAVPMGDGEEACADDDPGEGDNPGEDGDSDNSGNPDDVGVGGGGVPAPAGPTPSVAGALQGSAASSGGGAVSPHPLLSNEEWADLSQFAPEVTDSLTALGGLKTGLCTFDRPMGPDDAIKLIDGLEALGRINEALSILALAVCERVGTPTDFGAKTTKSLIQNRLNLTSREANRRTDMAKNLGGRVDFTGQALPPLYPQVAAAFNAGLLSAGQAAAIKDCMKALPTWVSQDVRDDAEATLVDKAPSVRVHDLRVIFGRILDHIDPDGQPPTDLADRCKYTITMHPRDNGDWEIAGLLDPVTGGQLHGLLTARTRIVKNTDNNDNDPNAAATETVDSAGVFSTGSAASAVGEETSNEQGVREDGTLVDMSGERLTAQEWIYERFATLIARIDMSRTGQGSPYALVVTAKAEDLAAGTGTGTTGSENPIPISELVRHGLNGAVFFELVSQKAKTMQVVTENRYANAKQIAILTARDQGCSFPGCDAPPGWCDAHHIVEWARGGKTDINNMTLSCSAHHHLLDRSEWSTVMLHDGRPAWVPPPSIDPARRPILHARFVAQDAIETLFDD